MKMKLMFLVVALAVFAGPAQAVLVGQYRLAFTTSEAHDTVSTDITVYNDWVQSLATAAGLPGTDWRVIGSTPDVDARDNTETNPLVDGVGVPIYLVDRITKVADDNADLWDGNIDHIIDQDENGGADYVNLWCFTGSLLDGTEATSEFGSFGNPLNGNVTQGNGNRVDQWIWRTWTGKPTTNELSMYAMSEILPEPATISLLALGGLGLLRRRNG